MSSPNSGNWDEYPRFGRNERATENSDLSNSFFHNRDNPHQNHADYEKGESREHGSVSAVDAYLWAAGTIIRNWKLWILAMVVVFFFGVLYMAVLRGINGISSNEAGGGLGSVLQLLYILSLMLLSVIGMRLALFQIDDSRTGWDYLVKDVRWWQPLVIMAVIGVIMTLIALMVAGPLIFGLLNGLEGASSNKEVNALVFGLLALVVLLTFLGSFIQPFYALMQWFAADGDRLSDAVTSGFKVGKENYTQLLIFMLLKFFILLAGSILLGIGLIVAYPVTLLAQAHMFRQCAGRNTLPQA